MVVVVGGLHDDALAAIADELFDGGDLQALLDNAGMEAAARGGGEAEEEEEEEEELEWLSNKDAFPTVETMAPAPAVVVVVERKKVARRGPRPQGPNAAAEGEGLQCRHCGTTKTPQWREGPEGRRTLCNACGVRYRSGRLVPEYRPLNSPTFSPELHSNLHRRVLQLRLQ
ncbi:GATA transcription factor 7-like, partial [Oryza brachyantha]|uniref:GATA transcription factor 7-like n=1 Tax=Oryza brachyantha TaxID=4533 RepID=UPI001ADB9F1F